MTAIVGFPTQRFIDTNSGDRNAHYYRILGCGDVITVTSSSVPEGGLDTCPLHGPMGIVATNATNPLGTSVLDPS